MNPRQITSLSGPIAFYYYKLNNRKIVLLSDVHFHGTKCHYDYGVVDWVMDLSQYDCIDFFVEQSYIKNPIVKITNYATSNTLSNIINRFEPYYINKKYVHIDNLRYHYIDVRSFKLDNGTLYLFTPVNPVNKKLLSNTGYKSNIFNIEKHIDHLENIVLYLMCLNKKDDYINLINDVNQFALGKSLFMKNKNKTYNVSSGLTYDDLMLYMTIYCMIIKKRQLKYQGDLSSFNRCFMKLVIRRCQQLLTGLDITAITPIRTFAILRELANIPIHYYSLLRMFGHYKDNNRCENYNKNIIMYAGHNHTLFINEFILDYFNTTPEMFIINQTDTKNLTANQCIQFDEPFDYFY